MASRNQGSAQLCTVAAALRAILAVGGFVAFAFLGAGLADAGAEFAHGWDLGAVSCHDRGGHAADVGAVEVHGGAFQHVLGVNVTQAGCGAEIAHQGTARACGDGLPIGRFGQSGGRVEHERESFLCVIEQVKEVSR